MGRKAILIGAVVVVAGLVFAMAITRGPVPAIEIPPPHFEAIGTVSYVVDGDTIWVSLTWVQENVKGITARTSESVRFSGGIDAPEMGSEGGREASGFISGLCPTGAEVYLDLEDKAIGYRDAYSRLLAVIYVRIDNSWVNVNAELLRWGMEAYPRHNWLRYTFYSSESDPYEWLENDYPYVRG
ncbi:MAG: thermonuclease family protein [Candidatus Hodarchaeaceae archaeon]|nr:thermonuclease family protein [Candidatus Hodarchaeaceae archaeon]